MFVIVNFITLIVIDREVDLISPLVTPLTYEGLLDDLLGIESGTIKLEAGVLGDDKGDEMPLMAMKVRARKPNTNTNTNPNTNTNLRPTRWRTRQLPCAIQQARNPLPSCLALLAVLVGRILYYVSYI